MDEPRMPRTVADLAEDGDAPPFWPVHQAQSLMENAADGLARILNRPADDPNLPAEAREALTAAMEDARWHEAALAGLYERLTGEQPHQRGDVKPAGPWG